MVRRNTIALLTAAVSCAGAPAALAQADPAVRQPVADRLAAGEPLEIIVTARKRDERAIDVPVAISALSGETLERFATSSLTAISERVPQLVVGESTNQTGGSINLRGVGAGIANPWPAQARRWHGSGDRASQRWRPGRQPAIEGE